jgi:hypothetical protein
MEQIDSIKEYQMITGQLPSDSTPSYNCSKDESPKDTQTKCEKDNTYDKSTAPITKTS